MNLNLDMNQLRAFVTVAELRSFSKASHKLCRVQSAVSQQVQKLEGHLGSALFIRGNRTLELTAHGERMLAYAIKILDINDQAVAKLTDNSYKGIVRVGTSDTYASHYFSDIIRHCAECFPDIEIEVHCGYSSQMWQYYETGELDVVLTQGCPSSIPSELLHSEPLQWVCAHGCQVMDKDPVPLALFTQGCADRDLILNTLNRVNKAYRVRYHSTSHAGILAALSSGCYVSAVLLSTVHEELRILGECEGFPVIGSLDISLAYHDKAKSSLSSLFADISRSYFQSLSADHVFSVRRAWAV